MPSLRQIWPDALPTAESVQQLLDTLRSERPVRPIVTPSGHRARGYFPSLKGARTRFESLVEEDTLRALEVATSVLTIETHPWVLALTDADGKTFHYTPDAFVVHRQTAMLIESKGDWLLRLRVPADAMLRTFSALERHGVPIVLLTESELRADGLQDELKALLRLRPVGGRGRRVTDLTEWDVIGASRPSGELLARWRAAQQACDALLDRVMHRGPDEAITASCV